MPQKRRIQITIVAGLLLIAGSLAVVHRLRAKPAGSASAPAVRIKGWQAAVLGAVEGLTEYLPVSSTGHLILTGRWIGLENGGGLKNEALDSFNVVIQIGAALAVAVLYWRRLEQVGVGLFRGDPGGRRLLGLLIVAFMPAAVVGLALHKRITEYLFFPLPVAGALVVGGVVMVGVELYRRRHAPRTTSLDAMTCRQALIIGLAQCLALWPGTSRSMTTIVAALLVGLSPLTAAEFSFLLALPVLTAAAGLEVVKDFDKLLLYAGPGAILVGLGVSALVAVLAVEAFVRWVSKHGMTPFGVYRIIVGLVVYWVLMR